MENPILIVGAGRSGTKLLRSVLAAHPDLEPFPREINYIWRYGNAGHATDELLPEHARPEVIRYIRKRFRLFCRRLGDARVIEKTCANSLRLEFLHRVFPESRIIHLIRDGRSVAESAARCWRASPSPSYLLEKLRWVPARDYPVYAGRFLRYQIHRFESGERHQASWGPRFRGIDDMVSRQTLIEICGLQWQACVRAAEAARTRLPPGTVMSVRYEDLVNDTGGFLETLCTRLDLPLTEEMRQVARKTVSRGHLEKWRERLSAEKLDLLLPRIESLLAELGYR